MRRRTVDGDGPVTINSQMIDGDCYLHAQDLADALRIRAEECEQEADQLGDDLDCEDYTTAVAWHTVAEELRQRADAIDFGVIVHLSGTS